MCGVLLIFSKKKKLNEKICNSANEYIKSRGPDIFLENYFLDNRLYISNSILSIVGSINSKKKLFESKNKNFSIAFNGELYNWKEIKNSNKNLQYCKNDTELLVNMHEELNPINVAKKIDGMFAYCTYNKKKREIYFASDVQGEKKLFYYNDSNYLIISSTISSILSFLNKKDLNLNSINSYFVTRHYLFFDDTCYNNIKIIKPGNAYTFNLDNDTLIKKDFDDPLLWISQKKMRYFEKMKEMDLVEYFENLLLDQLKKMIPDTKFGSIFSGGIDSSLQTVLLSKIKNPNEIITLNHVGKDEITKNIIKFQKFIKNKIKVLDINKNDYINDLEKSYKITQFPFLTHDFVGKYQLSKFFRERNCKVFFGADGVDELFGGYEIYSKINWNNNKIINHSPYSNIDNSKKIGNMKIPQKISKLWQEAYFRYEFQRNKADQKIQASLFTDYFIQAVSVGNIGTDIMCSNNGIEPRNVYIQKKIIKEIINIPARHKIDLRSRDSKMILKPLLKKIFLKYFPKKLIYKKQGFSGFPNDTKVLQGKNLFLKTNNLLKTNFNRNSKITKELEWKLLNLEFFLKFANIK